MSIAARALTFAAKRPASSNRLRANGHIHASSRRIFRPCLVFWMCPTIVSNVETLCNVKYIVAMGGAAFCESGTPNNTGTRIVSLSGQVKKPGYYEIEVGKATLGELINDPKIRRRSAGWPQVKSCDSRWFIR